MQPIVPDWTAFGAATERDTHGDHAQNQYQTPEHRRSLPHAVSYGLKSGIFKPRSAAVLFGQMRSKIPDSSSVRRGTSVHATTTGRGVRYRGSQARPWRRVCTVGP